MKFDVSRIVPDRRFCVDGASYIGRPRSNTAMYITKKVEVLLSALDSVTECLIFAESGIVVPDVILERHAFHFSDKPQLSYARFAQQFADEREAEERKLEIRLAKGGYYLCEGSVIGADAVIEPGVFIGPDVRIGNNARILAGTVIRHTTIGDDFVANEFAVIGANGFTMAEDEEGNKIRIPTLGRVEIGNHVEIGAQNNVSCGSGGNTVIEDYVKLDALIHIGHDVHLRKNVEITAGVTVGGFTELGEHAYVGVNAVLRNRIRIGDNAVIGMGATVTKSVEANTTVAGNPARLFERQQKTGG